MRFYQRPHKFYCGVDLHARTMYLCILGAFLEAIRRTKAPPMNHCLRTAGCPDVERNLLTGPTGGASPVSTPRGAESPVAQLRHQVEHVPWKRRRQGRDAFLGREGKPSQSLDRKAQRQTLYTCLVQPAREVDARI